MLGLYVMTMLGMLGLHARTPMPGARGRHRMQGSSPGGCGQPRARMVSWHGVPARQSYSQREFLGTPSIPSMEFLAWSS